MDHNNFEYPSNDIELAENTKLKPPSDSSSSTSHFDSKDDSSSTSPPASHQCIRVLLFPVMLWTMFYHKFKPYFHNCFYAALLLGYAVYFLAALIFDSSNAIPLVIVTAIVVTVVLYELCMLQFGKRLKKSWKNFSNQECRKKLYMVCLVFGGLLAVGFLLWLFIEVIIRNPKQLYSLFGFFIILLVCVWGSKYPEHINWRPVIWGIMLQFLLGAFVMRFDPGYHAIKFIGDEIATFMNYSESGASFVFGKGFKIHFFAFKVLPMVIFFSTFTNMLFYVGLMQWFIGKLSYITQKTLGTSAIESTVAAANIFVGMTEAPLMVRPYLSDLTNAEIHSMLTAGLGSIAFSVFGAFVEFKVDSVHLLTACVMSAPASLVVSRMLYPERKKSKFVDSDSLVLTAGTERNIIEAAAVGASTSINLVANIAANLIAFLSLLAFVNSTLQWFGAFIGVPHLTFEVICGYLFMPVAFLLGADWEDCFVVGKLFGVKTFLNEFVAYEDMQPYIERRLNATYDKYDMNGEVLYMSERSEVIAIHALCGFCNVGSLGIIIGGLGVLMPTRRPDIVKMAVRALIGGILTCCMTASIAGFLFKESVQSTDMYIGNVTEMVNVIEDFQATTLAIDLSSLMP